MKQKKIKANKKKEREISCNYEDDEDENDFLAG